MVSRFLRSRPRAFTRLGLSFKPFPRSRPSSLPQHSAKWAQNGLAAVRRQGCSKVTPQPSHWMTPASPITTFVPGAAKGLSLARKTSRNRTFKSAHGTQGMLHSASRSEKRSFRILQSRLNFEIVPLWTDGEPDFLKNYFWQDRWAGLQLLRMLATLRPGIEFKA